MLTGVVKGCRFEGDVVPASTVSVFIGTRFSPIVDRGDAVPCRLAGALSAVHGAGGGAAVVGLPVAGSG